MKEVHPFLEVMPDYLRTLSIDLVMDFVTILILALLIVQYFRRKHRSFELTLFFQMCICNLLMVLCSMIFDIVPVFWVLDEDNVGYLLLTRFVVAWVIDQIFAVTLLAQWLIYVEYTLHRSRDLIRRRYPAAMVMFFAAAGMMAVSLPVAFWHDAPFDRILVYIVLSIISHVILLLFIIAAYVVLYLEKKRNRIPEYIRLTPTTLCVITGFVVNLFLTEEFSILPFFFALGLLFADFYMYRRLKNIDPKTGLFNRRYLSVLKKTAAEQKLKGATFFRFKVKRGSDVMAEILKAWVPEPCRTVIMGDGLFLVVSAPIAGALSERFIFLVTEQAKNRGIPVEADSLTDRKEPMDKLLGRINTESAAFMP